MSSSQSSTPCGRCKVLRDQLYTVGDELDVLIPENRRLREALQVARFALRDVQATRKTDAWGNAVTEATKALTTIDEALA